MQNKFVSTFSDDVVIEATNRYGIKNIGYEVEKAFIANLKRLRNIEAAKEAKRRDRSEG